MALLDLGRAPSLQFGRANQPLSSRPWKPPRPRSGLRSERRSEHPRLLLRTAPRERHDASRLGCPSRATTRGPLLPPLANPHRHFCVSRDRRSRPAPRESRPQRGGPRRRRWLPGVLRLGPPFRDFRRDPGRGLLTLPPHARTALSTHLHHCRPGLCRLCSGPGSGRRGLYEPLRLRQPHSSSSLLR